MPVLNFTSALFTPRLWGAPPCAALGAGDIETQRQSQSGRGGGREGALGNAGVAAIWGQRRGTGLGRGAVQAGGDVEATSRDVCRRALWIRGSSGRERTRMGERLVAPWGRHRRRVLGGRGRAGASRAGHTGSWLHLSLSVLSGVTENNLHFGKGERADDKKKKKKEAAASALTSSTRDASLERRLRR